MAKLLFFDIETIPGGEESMETLKYLYERKRTKFIEGNTDEEKEFMTFEEFYNKTCLDGSYGRIVCIGYALGDKPAEVLVGDERAQLQKFWDIAANIDIFVGHNIRDFDLPFIMQRSVVLGVKPSWNKFQDPGKKPWEMTKFLDFARYKNCPIFDVMWEWNHWRDKWENKTIEHVAMALGIPTPKTGIDGSKVFEFYKAGKAQEIAEYCRRDVETTREVYKKITFLGVETREVEPF